MAQSARDKRTEGLARRSVLMVAVAIGLICALMAYTTALAGPATGATKEQCLPKLLQPPHLTEAVMLNPSKAEVLFKGSFSGVEDCDSWRRLGKYRVQIKQAGHWLNLEGDFWYPTGGSDIADENAAYKFAFLAFATHNVHEQCVNGHWEPARVQLRNSVRNAGSGKIAAQGKIAIHPIKFKRTTVC